jgi:hypothetical protein
VQLLWHQFRRLFLGTVVEALVELGLPARLASLRLDFHEDSAFRVPRLDNYMRFRGEVRLQLDGAPDEGQVRALRERLRQAWPELLGVLDVPVGDRLTEERNELRVEAGAPEADGVPLRIAFDLVAD